VDVTHATRSGRAGFHGLVVAIALLVVALAGLGSPSSAPQVQRPAGLVVGSSASDHEITASMATRVTGFPSQISTWSGSGVEAASAQLLGAVLLASLLLALLRLLPPPFRSARSLPRRRGPPRVAFVN